MRELLTTRIELVARPEAARSARRHVRDALNAWQITAGRCDDTELVVSELVGNTVRHSAGAQTATDSVPVVLTLSYVSAEGCLRVEVTDRSSRQPRYRGRPGDDAESGRGLFLVEAVSKEWGCISMPGGGKTVWCRIEAP
ncbi:ATP-binding protein [Streptomyces sp. DT24]|uniref:ATP-binding protein n=1 Tax=Streptomyces sp. DT24 TaxID=3416520 RepID=UPI003CE71BB9